MNSLKMVMNGQVTITVTPRYIKRNSNCKINKKVALVFTELYGDRDDTEIQLWNDNYFHMFPIASKLELQNGANIFVLSYNNLILGTKLINKLLKSYFIYY